MTPLRDDELDTALPGRVTRADEGGPTAFKVDEVATRGRRRRPARRTLVGAAYVLAVVFVAVALSCSNENAAIDTGGPSQSGPSSATAASGINPGTIQPTPAPGGTTAVTAATTIGSTTTTTALAPTTRALPPPTSVTAVPTPTAPTTVDPASAFSLGIDGFSGVPFTTPMAQTVAVLRARFGTEDYDSGFVAGCGPGSQNRWLRWGRLQVGFTMSNGDALFSEWQYPGQITGPDIPPPPTSGGPELTTEGGLGPSGPPRPRATIVDEFRREFPGAVENGASADLYAEQGDDTISANFSTPDPDATTIRFLTGENTRLFSSIC